MDYSRYATLKPGATHEQVRTLQCLLRRQKLYTGPMTGTMDAATVSSVRSMRQARGLSGGATVGARAWATLLAAGGGGLKKYGANGEAVRQLQRTLNALYPASVPVTGVFEARTTAAVKRYQADLGLSRSGVVVPTVWTALRAGRRP
jgi:peptidoglycan hydrolase-like protein with peptidoglycan-binding domain